LSPMVRGRPGRAAVKSCFPHRLLAKLPRMSSRCNVRFFPRTPNLAFLAPPNIRDRAAREFAPVGTRGGPLRGRTFDRAFAYRVTLAPGRAEIVADRRLNPCASGLHDGHISKTVDAVREPRRSMGHGPCVGRDCTVRFNRTEVNNVCRRDSGRADRVLLGRTP
jgi:hypothetical protein